MRSKKINGTIIFNIILLALQFSILVLEMLPNAVMIPFSSGPNSWVTSTCMPIAAEIPCFIPTRPGICGKPCLILAVLRGALGT